ncbi:MAG: DNA repair protein RecN [Desulfobacterales bacterium]
MLQELAIRNFAIIEDARIAFESGLTILSGETGAGKSIILNAVNLLLGARASSALIRTGAESAELEALFKIAPDGDIAQAMQAHDLDPAEGFIVRRVISRGNRHRVYLNGRLATTQTLTAIAGRLASIAGQHAQQMLLDEAAHLHILDQYAALSALRQEVTALYRTSNPLIRRLNKLTSRRQTQAADLELLQHQIAEIEQAALEPDEDQVLESEIRRLRHGRTLMETVQTSREALYTGEGAVIERLQGIEKALRQASQMDAALAPLAEILAESHFRIEEVASQLDSYAAGIDLDGRRLEAAETRLDRIQKLKRKYGGSLEAVSARLADARRECESLESLDNRIRTLEDELRELGRSLFAKAQALSDQRRQGAQKLARAVETELASLSIGNTRMEVEFETHPPQSGTSPYHQSNGRRVTAEGLDRCRFLISPNVGEIPKPLKAIASGGELSRIILAIKAILAATEAVQSLIFDEVDAGIGGAVGEVVGRKLARLATHHQVLCITHLPQIAVFGDQHFKIVKSVDAGRTRTTIHSVAPAEQVQEIARMLGGIRITNATRKHAKELLTAAKG